MGDIWGVFQPMCICMPFSGALNAMLSATWSRGPALRSSLVQQSTAGLASSVSMPFQSPFQELSALQGRTVSLARKGQWLQPWALLRES